MAKDRQVPPQARQQPSPAAERARPGIMGRVAGHLKERVKAFVPEVIRTVTDRVIPQGAAELAQALNSGSNAYVPYGHGQRPIEPVGNDTKGNVHGSYEQSLKDYASRGKHQGKDQSKDIEL